MKTTYNEDKLAVLSNEEGRHIAIIQCPKGEDISKRIELSVAEYECAESAKLLTNLSLDSDALTIEVQTEENGEDCIREYEIEILPVY